MKRLAAALLLFASAAAGDVPQRIVSANLCADRLVLALVGRERIVSVSRFAADPDLSTVADQARTIPANHGDAEEIAALHPDLVIFGQYTQRANAEMLKSLGYRVYMLPVASDLAGMRKTIADLAARLGVPERGDALISEIDNGLAGLAPHSPAKAVFYTAGGWTSGRPSLADDLLARLGATNIATEARLGSSGTLPLETLVAAGPQLIIFETMGRRDQVSLSAELLDHPALAERGIRRLDMPMKLWDCADGAIVAAARLIDEALP